MNAAEYSETQKIELATAEAFFGLYNAQHATSYSVNRVAGPTEVPDIFASDGDGREFNLEITLTEDRPGNIAALLGRSDSLSIEPLAKLAVQMDFSARTAGEMGRRRPFLA